MMGMNYLSFKQKYPICILAKLNSEPETDGLLSASDLVC